MRYIETYDVKIESVGGNAPKAELDKAADALEEILKPVLHMMDVSEFFDRDGSYDYWFGDEDWYTCEDDMKALSARFPDLYFAVSCEYEDAPEDNWVSYFCRGKQQDGYMTVRVPFDIEKCLDRPMYWVEGAVAMLEQGGYGDVGRKVMELCHVGY